MQLMSPETFLKIVQTAGHLDGAAFDIDETLCETDEYWFSALVERFGNPENLTSEEIVLKYRYYQHYWNTPSAHRFMNELAESDELTLAMHPVKGARDSVHEVCRHTPTYCYITARPPVVRASTLAWLVKHGFPSGALIMRPPEVPLEQGSRWKAAVLRLLYPHIGHTFDDSLPLLEHLGSDYLGRVYFLKVRTLIEGTVLARPCPTWPDALTHFHLLRRP